MALADDLYRIEEGFWRGGRDHFLAHVDATCLLAFPQMPEMHGVHSRAEVAETASDPARWRELSMTDRQLVQPGAEVAIISYRADAVGREGQGYSALIGSAYVRRDDGWKLTFHQHSPV